MSDRIPAGTKCVIKSIPEGSTLYADLKDALCTPSEKNAEGGSRGTGTQFFDLTGRTGQGVFGNGDSGFVVEAVKG